MPPLANKNHHLGCFSTTGGRKFGQSRSVGLCRHHDHCFYVDDDDGDESDEDGDDDDDYDYHDDDHDHENDDDAYT